MIYGFSNDLNSVTYELPNDFNLTLELWVKNVLLTVGKTPNFNFSLLVVECDFFYKTSSLAENNSAI